tara:strand:- start:33 stop:3434 length:3402 start_codon:yes stop_codon:yes gene_type:complete
MPITEIKEFVLRLEKENLPAGKGMWRKTWVVPALMSPTKKKEYINERPSASAEQIATTIPRKSGNGEDPGRGMEQLSPWHIKTFAEKGAKDAELCFSIYLKHAKDLYVIDFDTAERCQTEEVTMDNGTIIPPNPLFCHLLEQDTPYTKTAKGYHFYIYIRDMPLFSSGLKCAQDQSLMGEVDIIGRRHPSASNIVERSQAILTNGSNDIYEVPFSEFKEFLDEDKLFGRDKMKDGQLSKQDKEATNAILSSSTELPIEKFQSYLERLRKVDCPGDETKKSRYHYSEYVNVGIVCWNNFADKDRGFDVWCQWVRADPEVSVPGSDHSKRTASVLLDKWSGFSEQENPLTWKSLRSWANEDDYSGTHIYQEIYDQSGRSGVITYMNSFLCFSTRSSEYVFDDPNDDSDYASFCMKKAPDCSTIFECYDIKTEDDAGKIKFISPFQMWKKSCERKNVCSVNFDPSPFASKRIYNLFQGFQVPQESLNHITMEEAEIEIAPLIEHIRFIWCKGNPILFDYTMNWFAWILQRPWIKIGVMLAVKSKEGGGKGIVFDFMRNILGNRLYAQINSLDRIIGKNNSVLEGRLLINGDEIVWGGDTKAGNALKCIITEEEIWIEEKYRAQIKIKNTTAICLSSNEKRPLSCKDGDRRSYGLELANTWAGRATTARHREYFQAISGKTHAGIHQDKVQAFAKYLFNRDLTGFNHKDIPITDFVTQQMETNMDAVTKWWYHVLQNGAFQLESKHTKSTMVEVQTEFGTKMEHHAYDFDQLVWGNVSDKWKNGLKDAEMIYSNVSPQKAVYGYAFFAGDDWEGGDNYSWSGPNVWQRFLVWVKEEGHYEFSDTDDLTTIPMPEWFPNLPIWDSIKSQRLGSTRRLDDEDLDYDDTTFKNATALGSDGIQPSGRKNEILVRTNPHIDKWMFSETFSRFHFDDLVAPGSYDKVVKLQKSSGSDYDAMPHFYYRKSDSPFFSATKAPNEPYKFEVTDQVLLEEYLDEWSGGVNVANFSTDLVGKHFLGEDGEQMFLTEKREKIKTWCYDKEWIFTKYMESSGGGYGHTNEDVGSFWSAMSEMMGGPDKPEDPNITPGKMRTFRKSHNGVRRNYWKINSLDTCRGCFEKHVSRICKWTAEEDSEDEEDEW